MSGPVDVEALISLLESSDLQAWQPIQELVQENLYNSKEAWLINALVDSYVLSRSPRCLEIIATVREPHDKHVFDRILDHVKGPQDKLPALTILATLVYKQPPWLHKIISHQLMQQVIKILKNDNDVPVLLSGLLIIAALLPVVPVTINTFLPHIFDAFSRLAAFCLKRPANVPEIYLYHLRVGVYCLHHRLYGMYPYHFLTFLRNVYSRQEQQQVFELIVKPMVDKVRLHPLLFTTTREKEVSRDRWRQKEVHDILVECAQFSLDLTEGSTSEMSAQGPQKMADCTRTGPKLFGSLSDWLGPGSLVAGVDPSNLMTCGPQGSGVMTPPISQSASEPPTPGSAHFRGPTPIQQALYSPVHDGDKMSLSRKRHKSALPGLTIAGKLPASTDISPYVPEGQCSVPPSPLRADFTNEPPITAQRLQAIRKLSFQQSDASAHQTDVGKALEKILSNSDKFARPLPGKAPSPKSQEGPPTQGAHDSKTTTDNKPVSEGSKAEHTEQFQSAKVAEADTSKVDKPGKISAEKPTKGESSNSQNITSGESFQKETVGVQAGTDLKVLAPQDVSPEKAVQPHVDLEGVPSVNQLPKFLDSLDVQTGDTDCEISELIQSASVQVDPPEDDESDASDQPLPDMKTAESVAAFMKKVNRIRFNSMNVARDKAETMDNKRASSCPDLDPENEEKSKMDELLEAISPLPSEIVEFSIDHSSNKSMKSSSSQTSLYALSSALLEKRNSLTEPLPMVSENVSTDADSPMESFPYQELFSLSLPFSPFIQCYQCVMSQRIGGDTQAKKKQLPVLDDHVPLYTSCSPVELLDRLLDNASESHNKQSTGAPPGSHPKSSDYTSCEDVGILRGQISMLHNQLLFERHKRELHAQRNRRLLSRIVKTTALQEQNIAMRDQLQLLENELGSLRQALHQQQASNQKLNQSVTTHETENEKMQKTYHQKLESLQKHTRDTEAQLREAKDGENKANKELEGQRALVYSLQKEVEVLKTKTEHSTELKDQVKRLNKELLLMGELQQKYQSRLVTLNTKENANVLHQFLLDTYKNELNIVKNDLAKKSVTADNYGARIKELEDTLKVKDKALREQTILTETTRETYLQKIKSVEDKYEGMKKAHLALQAEFLTVNSKIGLLEAAAQRAANQRGGMRPLTPDLELEEGGASAGAEGWGQRPSGQEETFADWTGPASEGSVESAEEAVAMETLSQ